MIQIHELEQGADEWHKLRQGKYTGSNAHKLLKYGAIDYALTQASNFKGNFYTKRGGILEHEAIELYATIKQCTVTRPGFVTNTGYPLCGYSPDGLTDDRVVEVKCFNKTRHMQIFKGEIPIEVLAQVHFGMLICDKPYAHLVIYNPDLDPTYAFKSITIRATRNIQNNFKRILSQDKVMA